MRDARVDVSPIGVYTVTIDTHRHGKIRRGSGCPLQRSALTGCCPQTTGQRPTLPRRAHRTLQLFIVFLEQIAEPPQQRKSPSSVE